MLDYTRQQGPGGWSNMVILLFVILGQSHLRVIQRRAEMKEEPDPQCWMRCQFSGVIPPHPPRRIIQSKKVWDRGFFGSIKLELS